MDNGLIITTVVTIILALLGYLITYINNIRISQRKEQLERVNRQLSELYGPLFALTFANDAAYRTLIARYRNPYANIFHDTQGENPKLYTDWRLWITIIFMPNNERMYELIVSKADLLIESEMPECLLRLCAHVASYKEVIEKWKNKDYTEHLPQIEYPDNLLEYCRISFQLLKEKQANLIGVISSKTHETNYLELLNSITEQAKKRTSLYQSFISNNEQMKFPFKQND